MSKNRRAQPGRSVVPELLERLLEQVGRVQPLVGLEQQLQRLSSPEGQVLPARQQGVLLPLDEAAFLSREAGVFALADLVHGLLQMTQHMELVVDDPGLGSVAFLEGGVAERLPHVHDRQADLAGIFRGRARQRTGPGSPRSGPVPPNQMGRPRTRSLTTMR